MKNIVVIGAAGQIGSEMVMDFRKRYGATNVVAGYSTTMPSDEVMQSGPSAHIDVRKSDELVEVIKKHNIDTIINLAALLSATAESKFALAWDINVNGLLNLLEICKEFKTALMTPSSIAVFGPSTPKDNTPQDTIMHPSTVYGISKVTGELLCDYYFHKFGVDTRGLRYPGIISNVTKPGGGTTDYAVHIYYDAVEKGKYTCFLKEGTQIDMMYMPDAIEAAVQLMEADPAKLIHRNAFNVTAMSFAPEHIAAEIKKVIPTFTMDYDVDPMRQAIADSWPNSIDDSAARAEWGWKPKYDLTSMTKDMIEVLRSRS